MGRFESKMGANVCSPTGNTKEPNVESKYL